MEKFEAVYRRLNPAQREAVDTIYGPVLVIAGPGTGKTQLLSARVAHILQLTDTLPQNILCLTFTESGASNMRERLTRFIGTGAYDVQIGTYHAFGRTVIGRYPEYFTDLRLERPIDTLGQHRILAQILNEVEYRSPIKQVRHHLGDLISTISEVKRGLLTPEALRALAAENLAVIATISPAISEILQPYAARMPSKLSVAGPLFDQIAEQLTEVAPAVPTSARYPHYASLALDELRAASETAAKLDKTTPLTKWKNKWLVKNQQNQFVLAGGLEARRIDALADVIERYQAAMTAQGLYDFDDMILRAIEVLEQNDDLRYTLQEQYQFVVLDEFQDTNAAQLKLVQLLTDNPVYEGRPNVLAVGDDDQAIYAFQGALSSNMLDFFALYRDVSVVTLTENYRSRSEILQTAAHVADQIETRLQHKLPGITKTLQAKATALSPLALERREFVSDVAERAGIANQVKSLIGQGVKPSEIAVLAPKHKYLEPLVPYLRAVDVPVSYEKRENILEAPVVRQVLTMADLVLALQKGQHALADSLWPEVLSYDMWGFATEQIWQISWQASDKRKSWAELLLANSELKHAALLFLTLAGRVSTDSCEALLDALLGSVDVQTKDLVMPSVRSPLRDYYFKAQGEQVLFETVTELTVLREKLREYQASENRVLTLGDLVDFVGQYRAAGEQMLNTSPYTQASDAVQLMTVFKAKGLEFRHVFLPSCHDDVWGSTASGMSNKLTLPSNLAPIRHAGATDDERLRLLFVALTRAKAGLYLSSFRANYAGKKPTRLKYFNEIADGEAVIARVLPDAYQQVVVDEADPPGLETLLLDWQSRHLVTTSAPLRSLLQNRLERYQLSPTHLTHFLDLKYGGPESFLLGTLLRFPSTPSIDASFGNAMHQALEWLQNEYNKTGTLPPDQAVMEYATQYLARQPFAPEQIVQQQKRAQDALALYLTKKRATLRRGDIAEKSFQSEGVLVEGAHLGGKIDLLEVDKAAKTITVVDYKTGSLGSDPVKLHRYTLQLYCYKLLVEGSHSYAGYTVRAGRLVFVEADTEGEIVEKTIHFEPAEVERVKKLLQALWRRVQSVDMPSTTGYGEGLRETMRFESDLIAAASD